MTREEAITVLEGLSNNPLFSNQHKAAFNIAIHDIKQRHDWDINNLILINKDDYEPLEQEPCEDAVSRKSVITIIQNHWWNCRDIDKLVNELPSVTPQESRWIPVSERLPDTDDEVLCWYEYYHWSQKKVLPDYGIGCYFKETSAWYGEVAVGRDVRVIAWMPLSPYREVEE